MRAPSPTWETTYASNRRKHSHRCRCCDRIIAEGERVLMVRLRGYRGNKTWAIHLDPRPRQPGARNGYPALRAAIGCADQPFSDHGTWKWRDAFACWGTEHLRKCGWKIPEHPMMHPIETLRAVPAEQYFAERA